MTADLDAHALAFLKSTPWAQAEVAVLTQDASARRYYRLTHPTLRSAILMDASKSVAGEMARFLHIGRFLRDIGLSAPEIYEESADYLILEDFGNARFADLPTDPAALYGIALDVLLHLQTHPAPEGLPLCDAAHLGELAATALQFYPNSASGSRNSESDAVAELVVSLSQCLDLTPSCVMLRDYHAENVMWLPDREGYARAGLLDFQDAMLGHPAFDVVSLLQDARRDIDLDFEREMCTYFQTRSSLNADHFATSYAALGAIRNLRIIGMFTRLSRLLNRPHYVDFIPRVWAYLDRDLAHPALRDLRDMVANTLPAPTKSYLEFLKSACLTNPPQ